MPLFTPNGTIYPPTDGDPITAAAVRDIFHDAALPQRSFRVINLLDEDNIDPTWTIPPEYVQRGSQVDAWSIAGTANLDFRHSWWADYDSTATFAQAPSNPPTEALRWARAIPGASKPFRLRYDCTVVRLSWTVMWTNDCSGDDLQSQIFLKVDDEFQYGCMRRVGQTVYSGNHEGYKKSRWWSGHTIVELDKGYHRAGLWLVADPGIRNTRIWSRSFNVVAYQ